MPPSPAPATFLTLVPPSPATSLTRRACFPAPVLLLLPLSQHRLSLLPYSYQLLAIDQTAPPLSPTLHRPVCSTKCTPPPQRNILAPPACMPVPSQTETYLGVRMQQCLHTAAVFFECDRVYPGSRTQGQTQSINLVIYVYPNKQILVNRPGVAGAVL